MEYDNDRILRHNSRTELYYWVFFMLFPPLLNGITLLPGEAPLWSLLLLVNLLLFPAYFLYSRIMGTFFIQRKRWDGAALMSLLTFLVVQAFLFTIYSLLLKFRLSPGAKSYFTYSRGTIFREALWALANMGFFMIVFHINKSVEEKEQLDRLQKENAFLQLRYLRSQLSPHFLFNTLNSIYSLSLKKSDQAPEAVIRLADIMRYLIYECNQDKIPLDKEIAFIRNYIEIEKIRYTADIRFTVEGATEGLMIEPYLFISFIENGFKHAMSHSFSEPFIYITLKAGEGQVSLQVINSAHPDEEIQAQQRLSGKGIATSKSLLELLYPDAYELDIIQTEKEENRFSELRLRNARERLESLYPDAFTLDMVLNKSSFIVSLIIKSRTT